MASGELKLNEGALVSPVGPPVIVVSGAVVSTVKSNVASDGSGLPAGSVATTWKR